MSVETATYISDLNTALPAATDPKSEGDDHIRLLKTTIKSTFPNVNGAVSATDVELSKLSGLSGGVVGTTDTQTLTNKTISADSNTLSGIAASSFVLSNASGNIDGSAAQKAIPSGAVVGTTDTQTLTNKTLSTGSTWSGNAISAQNGGTGQTSLTANNVILGNGTSAVNFVAPGASGNVLTSNGTTWTSAAASASLTGVTDGSSTFNTNLGEGTVNNSGATNNTAVGYQALRQNNLGDGNCAFGVQTLQALAGVNDNTFHVAVGYRALYSMATTGSNVAVGNNALFALVNGSWNTAVGSVALQAATSGYYNTAVGRDAGGAITTGYSNTCIGMWAGKSGTNNLTTGSNNTIIGYSAAASSSTATNEITLGNSSISTLRCQVTTITSLSDARDKTDIQDLDAGLEFVKKLKPVRFTWNMRDGGKVGEEDTGFIAQELKTVQEETGKAIPGLVFDVNPEKLEAGYGKLLPVLVKAIQDLSAEVESLKAQLESKNV